MKTYEHQVLGIITLIAVLFPVTALGQNGDLSKKKISEVFSRTGVIHTKAATETTGSPYLTETFLKGDIIQRNGAKTGTLYLRFDMEKNRVEFLRDKKILIADTKKLRGFNIYAKEHNIMFRNGYHISIKGIRTDTFLQIVYKSTLQLLALYKAKLYKNLPTFGTAVTKNKYLLTKKYFLVTKDGKFHYLKSPQKDILTILADHGHQLKKYAEANNLDFDQEADLVKILKYNEHLSR